MQSGHSQNRRLFEAIEPALKQRVQYEEAEHAKKGSSKAPNNLWDHMIRVALLAENIGRLEGVDTTACRLAGLFHDAGKFAGGNYHNDDQPEELYSVEVMYEICKSTQVAKELLAEVEDSILQIYRGDPDPTPLTQILFDADNLDKLGLLGIANYFIKAGLRGRTVSPALLYQSTVELTYARHAPQSLCTQTGRNIARKRAPQTILFIENLLESLREDSLFDFRIEQEDYKGFHIDVVSPAKCFCGEKVHRKIWDIPGLKCSEIHMEHFCMLCGTLHKMRFCQPRLFQLSS